jgi:DNA-binding MarR family transcriptional regulator
MPEDDERSTLLNEIEASLQRFLIDGGHGRIRTAHDLSQMTGVRLSASALLLLDLLGTRTMRVNDLGTEIGITSGGISRLIQYLEAKDVIDRIPDELDGRASLVSLSEKGLQIAQLLACMRKFFVRHSLKTWTEDEVKLIAPLLKRLGETVSETRPLDVLRGKIASESITTAEQWIRLIDEA